MNTLNKIFSSVLLVYSLLVLTSCEKILDIDPPKNERPSEVVFSSAETARAALSGAYSRLSSSQLISNNLTVANGLAADELRSTSAAQRFALLQNNTYQPFNSSTTSDMWDDSYTCIYRFNNIIAGLTNNSAVSASIATQIIAESKAMRAYCYMQLVNLFGDVPLVLTTNVTETTLYPRSTVAAVYAQIITDLTEAKAVLGEAYQVNAGAGASRMQINKSGAAALLARAYLANQNWAAAVSNASEVISNTGLYNLLPGNRINDVFLSNSSEAILQLGSTFVQTSGFTGEGSAFVSNSFSFNSAFALTNGLLSSFETGDLRASAWTRAVTFNGVTTFEPYKFKNYDSESATASGRFEVPMLIRLAELYLLRAEANEALGRTTESLADLNIIRVRAGLQPLTSAGNLKRAIEQERRIELFCELGDRWFSLKRTGRADEVLGALKPLTWMPFAKLYPIPQTAIDSNPNLIQNPGYR